MLRIEHGGDIYRNNITYDFSININPLGLPDGVKTALLQHIDDFACYPDPECETLVKRLSEIHQIPQDMIVCANGAAELIYRLVYHLQPKKALLLAPTFLEYEQALASVNCNVVNFYLQERHGFQIHMDELIKELTKDVEIVFFCNPNNPTGIPVTGEEIETLAKACDENGTYLVLDECFCQFLRDPERYSLISKLSQYPNMMILRAFTKTYAMAGIRLGYGMTGNLKLIQSVKLKWQPWSVSAVAQVAGLAALEETTYFAQAMTMIHEGREYLREELIKLGCSVYDSKANYLLFYYSGDLDLWEACKKRKILIRDCRNIKGLSGGYYRVCVRTMEENRILIHTLRSIIENTKENGRYEFISNNFSR